jgi:RNA-directed DNA polymerase
MGRGRRCWTLKAISRVCRGMRTRPLPDQHQRLSRMFKGHYAYFGISGNYERLATLPYQVARIWRKWLSRRSNERSMPWDTFTKILNLFP